MQLLDLFKNIKQSFCDVTSYKLRGDVLEVITAFITLNNKAVSVFIKNDKGLWIVTDNGWIESNYYENPINDESEDLENKVINAYAETYAIKITETKSGSLYYYKSTSNSDQIPSLVYDVASFILGSINARCVPYKNADEEKERETFRSDANRFLLRYYSDRVKLRTALDDYPTAKFSAIINIRSRLYLFMYITGSTPYYFEHDLNKTVVNFELAEKSKYSEIVEERIAIINDNSLGYHPSRYSSFIELVNEKLTRPALTWSDKQKVLNYVPPRNQSLDGG